MRFEPFDCNASRSMTPRKVHRARDRVSIRRVLRLKIESVGRLVSTFQDM